MTFDDDFMRFAMLSGAPKIVTLKAAGFHWPPPFQVSFAGFPFYRVSFSGLTDEERQAMTHVARGAEYEAVKTCEVPRMAPASVGELAPRDG